MASLPTQLNAIDWAEIRDEVAMGIALSRQSGVGRLFPAEVHAAHGTARHTKPFPDSEMIHQFFLRVDHIGNRENGKIHSVLFTGRRVL